MDNELLISIIKIRGIFVENVEDITMSQRQAISNLKYFSNLGSVSFGAGSKITIDTDKIIEKVTEEIEILIPEAKEDWEFEILEIWDDAIIKYVDCPICMPTKEDIDNSRDNLEEGEGEYQAFIVDGNLIFNENLGYPNKPLLKAQISYCPRCGRKLKK